MRMSEVIVQSAAAALRLQRPDGSFPPGRNGPYRDTDTPVRNTAHWLISLLKAHEIAHATAFRDAAARAANYLTTPELRPGGATFLCRTGSSKSASNGLIGQAWVIEALCTASSALGEPRYRELATAVFLLHPFDDEAGLWRIRDVDGRCGGYDWTFNHQLWFAAVGVAIGGTSSVCTTQAQRFLDCAQTRHLRVRAGCISHRFPAPHRLQRHPIRHLRSLLRFRCPRQWMTRQEVGYHAFNLYGLALLKQRFPFHPLWAQPKLALVLRFPKSDTYLQALEQNEYGYSYNPVGFEVALALQVFEPWDTDSASWWVTHQISRTYDHQQNVMRLGGGDPVTLAARLYEACRLQDVALRLPPSAE